MTCDVKINTQEYGGWKNCLKLSNGLIDLIATTDVGPRIIRFGFPGQRNEFLEIPGDMGTTGGENYRAYGGHRMWHAPESHPRTYVPDNQPVAWSRLKNGISLCQSMEPFTQIRKEIEIRMNPDQPEVRILHRIVNNNAWPIELAIWAITLMAPGGSQILPQTRKDSGLLPNRMFCLWPYSKMDDRRVSWGENYITITQDINNQAPFKLGYSNEQGWAAYIHDGHLFMIQFAHLNGEIYPDYGSSSCEAFTQHSIMEMESLSPLKKINPGETCEHMENWKLYQNIQSPRNEKEISQLAQLISV